MKKINLLSIILFSVLILGIPRLAFNLDMVLNFYAGTYPILTNARIVGPETKNDEMQYRFESTMGSSLMFIDRWSG